TPAAAPAPSPAKQFGQNLLQGLQKIGRSLQLPIPVLPAAGPLLRLGQADVFGNDGLGRDKVSAVFSAAAGTDFDNPPLLFTVGLSSGFSNTAHVSKALAPL
ncbi:hypothetical protein UK12_35240, partial [Saccharothrix sp. ST-888]